MQAQGAGDGASTVEARAALVWCRLEGGGAELRVRRGHRQAGGTGVCLASGWTASLGQATVG